MIERPWLTSWELELICPAEDSLVWCDASANRGWDRARILALLDGTGCTLTDGSRLSDEERNEIFLSAILAKTRHQVTRAFGSDATDLGTLVPALLLRSGRRLEEILPFHLRDQEFWTIRDFLERGYDHPEGDLTDPWVFPEFGD
jgi:hypothetical protein